jgi:2-polyprenyl-6-methoxyphenol hydroxylase-like FAD-dependent oxidoreductase
LDLDVITVGGGLGGSTLASAVAHCGRSVLVLEREKKFKDRVRGENMLPWGVAAAQRLGVVDDLLAAGGRQVPVFNVYFMGTQTEHRSFPMTTPTGEASLNMYHPDLQETLLAGAANAGAEVMRGAEVQSIAEQEGSWKVTFGEKRADAVRDRPACRRCGRSLLEHAADGRLHRPTRSGSPPDCGNPPGGHEGTR